MTEQELIEIWTRDKAAYAAWAAFVRHTIREVLATRIDVTVDHFVRICTAPRVKTDQSLLDKAFHRGKDYTDPYREITDKAGIRFVVLLTTDVDLVCDVIENATQWVAHKDRDPDAEVAANPLQFDYKSVHYIVECAAARESEGHRIEQGMNCEVQIRTLLQHAHSELTHNTIYKPKVLSTPAVKRAVAKAMALVEATDDYFLVAMRLLDEAAAPQQQALVLLGRFYSQRVGRPPAIDAVNLLLVDTYASSLEHLGDRVEAFCNAHPQVLQSINTRARHSHLFRQAAILLIYTVVAEDPRAAKRQWPLTEDSLAPVFVDLGLVIGHY